MKICSIGDQNGLNFKATLECEHCGHETEKVDCKNTTDYYCNVLPNMKCTECKKKRDE